MARENKLPPIIQQYLEKLNDERLPKWQRETAYVVLNNVRNQLNVSLQNYDLKTNRKAAKKE